MHAYLSFFCLSRLSSNSPCIAYIFLCVCSALINRQKMCSLLLIRATQKIPLFIQFIFICDIITCDLLSIFFVLILLSCGRISEQKKYYDNFFYRLSIRPSCSDLLTLVFAKNEKFYTTIL